MFTIVQLAKQTELTIETIRFYEKKTLIQPESRSESGYRLYDTQTVERLLSIKRAKALGFTIAEIGELLQITDLTSNTELSCEPVNLLTREKLTSIEDKIATLNRIKDKLRPLLDTCSSHEQIQDCPIVQNITDNNNT